MSQFVLTFTYLSSWLILLPLAFHILRHATVSAVDYAPNDVSKGVFSLYLSIRGLRKGPGKFLTGVLESLEKSWIFSSERVGTLIRGSFLKLVTFAVAFTWCYVAVHRLLR